MHFALLIFQGQPIKKLFGPRDWIIQKDFTMEKSLYAKHIASFIAKETCKKPLFYGDRRSEEQLSP